MFVQTRRDQLHAYRFQNRRALAALVTGEPNVVEPPMRRLTVTTISGIMIAILITVGFVIAGYISPSAGDKWKGAGAIIVERETGARYVLLGNVLHPVVNYSSAVLAVGTNQQAHVVLVDRSDLKSAKRGPTIGIADLPDSLPSAANLVRTPWSVCSRQQSGANDQLEARVSVLAGDDAGARLVPTNTAVVVRDMTPDSNRYLLLGGRRMAMPSTGVATALGVQSAPELRVGTAFLDGVPAGPDLQAPNLPKVGDRLNGLVDGTDAVVGQLLHVKENGQYFLVLADGVATLDPVQTALLLTLPIGSGKRPLAPLETTESVAVGLPTSKGDWPAVAAKLAGLPNQLPKLSRTAGEQGGVCAIYRNNSDRPTFAVPPSLLPAFHLPAVKESTKSQQGVADDVLLSSGGAAVAKTTGGSSTIFVVAAPGRKFAAASKEVLTGFGYGAVAPTELPVQLLSLIPRGAALDPDAARRPVAG
jgi:type VII secretion protein EccB